MMATSAVSAGGVMWWFLLAGGVLWVVGLCVAWCLCMIAKRADEAAREHRRTSGCATHGFPRAISAPVSDLRQSRRLEKGGTAQSG